jgi:hypothetical protein
MGGWGIGIKWPRRAVSPPVSRGVISLPYPAGALESASRNRRGRGWPCKVMGLAGWIGLSPASPFYSELDAEKR